MCCVVHWCDGNSGRMIMRHLLLAYGNPDSTSVGIVQGIYVNALKLHDVSTFVPNISFWEMAAWVNLGLFLSRFFRERMK